MTGASTDKLIALLELLQHWNRRINLTAVRDLEEMVAAHVLDSLAICHCLRGTSVIDIGTGAGFPGLPLAIALPELSFTLLDSNAKKTRFVAQAIGELEIDNADCVQARVEDYAPAKRFDTVTARALASLPQLADLAYPLIGEDGCLLALKGKYPAEELEAIAKHPDWDSAVSKLNVPGLEARERHVVCLTRAAINES